LALLKKISYRIEKMYLLYIFPLSSTYLWLRCSNIFNPSKNNSFGCAANREIRNRKRGRISTQWTNWLIRCQFEIYGQLIVVCGILVLVFHTCATLRNTTHLVWNWQIFDLILKAALFKTYQLQDLEQYNTEKFVYYKSWKHDTHTYTHMYYIPWYCI
jgi:hypothetical protein